MKSVYSAVQTGSVNKEVCVSSKGIICQFNSGFVEIDKKYRADYMKA